MVAVEAVVEMVEAVEVAMGAVGLLSTEIQMVE